MINVNTLKILISRKAEIESQLRCYGDSNIRFINIGDGALGIVYQHDARMASDYTGSTDAYLRGLLVLDDSSLYLYNETNELLTAYDFERADECRYSDLNAVRNLFDEMFDECGITVSELEWQEIDRLINPYAGVAIGQRSGVRQQRSEGYSDEDDNFCSEMDDEGPRKRKNAGAAKSVIGGLDEEDNMSSEMDDEVPQKLNSKGAVKNTVGLNKSADQGSGKWQSSVSSADSSSKFK